MDDYINDIQNVEEAAFDMSPSAPVESAPAGAKKPRKKKPTMEDFKVSKKITMDLPDEIAQTLQTVAKFQGKTSSELVCDLVEANYGSILTLQRQMYAAANKIKLD